MFSINLDVSDLSGLKEFQQAAEAVAKEATAELAAATHAKILELAAERLHSRRNMFVEAVSMREEEGVMVVELAGSARWIDDGLEPGFSMLDGLLASPKAKDAADGSRYIVVPFQLSKRPQDVPTSSEPMVEAVRAHMKREKIPWAKIERDDMGRPKLGLLHRFNVQGPLKTAHGPGQGWSSLNDVRQGPSPRQVEGLVSKNAGPGGGNPFLAGVGVYQRDVGGKTQRSVMTFRIASSKHRGQGRWTMDEGLEPVKIFDDAFDWALEEFQNRIEPELASRVAERL